MIKQKLKYLEPFFAKELCVSVGVCFNFLSCILSCVQLFATTWTVAFQTSLSVGLP